MKIIQNALARGAGNLTEHESKQFLAKFGIPVTREAVAHSEKEALVRASEIGYPVVLKGSGEALRHKTDLNLIALNLQDEKGLRRAYRQLTKNPEAEVKEVLVQEMIPGDRELMAISRIGNEHSQIREIDINPIKLVSGKPIAVDALIVFSAETR